MKGIELTFIFVLIIGITSLAILLLFFSGPFKEMLTDTYCFFNNHVFKAFGIDIGGKVCTQENCRAERVILEPLTKEHLMSQISAYSLLCWKEYPYCGKSAICYELVLKNSVEKITEEDLTKYLESQGACHILENSKVYNETDLKDYLNCGDEDLLQWDVDGYIIKDQKIILIQYDMTNNRIVVKA